MKLPVVSDRVFRGLSLATVVAIVGLVGTGGWVRLSESGLGCPTWPKCTAADIASNGSYHSLVEFTNRCLILVVGALIALVVLSALLAEVRRRELVWLSLALVLGYIGEAVLGGVTVLLKLAPVLVAAHLILSFLLLSVAVVVHWLATTPRPRRRGKLGLPQLRPVVSAPVLLSARVLAVLFWVTVILGTVVTGTGPHSGKPGTPRFHFNLLSVVQIHGSSGLVLFGFIAGTLVLLRATGAPATAQRRLLLAFILVMAQGALGLSIWFTGFTIGVIEAHMIGGALVLVALLRFTLALYEPLPEGAAAVAPDGAVPQPWPTSQGDLRALGQAPRS
ncbi:MAG: COX15/CtaA family protein [Candidatus Dormibacteraeota bacterium]|nr:COX15/CtaA family protein [Candidatus Dormibacteraeota bacterium]